MIDFTTVVGVDAKYFEQLKLSAETWRKFRPEIWQQPLIIFCDRDASMTGAVHDWARGTLGHRDANIIAWPPSGVAGECYQSQRHKMLAGHVHIPAMYCKTAWHLKIDTDSIALGSSDWIDPEWFKPDDGNRLPSIIAPKWHYTKPASQMGELDAWAATISDFDRTPPLNLPVEPGQKRVGHKRICSWVSFYNAAFVRWAAELPRPAYSLPVASQDGYHWYVAHRSGCLIRTANMKAKQWTNISRTRNLRKQVESIMQRTAD